MDVIEFFRAKGLSPIEFFDEFKEQTQEEQEWNIILLGRMIDLLGAWKKSLELYLDERKNGTN